MSDTKEKSPINWHLPVSLHPEPHHSKIANAKMKLDKVMNTIKGDSSVAYKV